MAWTQDDVDNLKTAIARGAIRARIGGEEVEYRDLAEMRSILSMMEAEVAGTVAGSFRLITPVLGRGL